MNSIDQITHYFGGLSDLQRARFSALKGLYEHWNAQINVISRKDLEQFNERHLLHALGIAKIIQFEPGAKVLDVGTGGGFPGIPLAILFPETQFTLVDSIGKKIKVVKEVAAALELTNVSAYHERAENIEGKFDMVVSRAVTAMPAFIPWVKTKFKKENNHPLKNGILYLKGGDLNDELAPIKQKYTVHPLKTFFKEEFFETKSVVYVQMN